MGFNYNDALSAFLILFAVIDILGNIPIIVSLRKKVGHVQSEKATIVAGAIMIVFLFVGESILNLLGVNVQSFAIAGSLVIFFLALEMVLGISLYKEETPNTASIVPIAFPLIAGAGTMTSLVSIRAWICHGQYSHCHCGQHDSSLCCFKKYGTIRANSRHRRLEYFAQGFRCYLARHCCEVILHQPHTST